MKTQKRNTLTENRMLMQNASFLHNVSMKYILSSSLAMLSIYAGAIIDTVIIGIFLGEEGLSVMSLVSPVYLFYYTAGAVVAIGGAVSASHHIGKGDYERYRRVFTCSVLLMLILAVIMTFCGLVFLDQISLVLGGGSTNTFFVREYLKYYIVGGGFTLLAYIPLYFLKADGRPRTSLALFFVFTVLNVVLTGLFMSDIFGLNIGGAALATVISMAVITIIGFLLLFDGKGETMLATGSLTGINIRSIIVTGIPSGLANLFEAIRIIIINTLLLRIDMVFLLPAFTVVRNILDLSQAVMLGISSALLPLISVFFSEHDNGSIRTVFKKVLRIGLAYAGTISLCVSIFPVTIAYVFGIRDSKIVEEIRLALPLACLGSLFAYFNIQLTGYFNTIFRSILSNAILFLRLILYLALSAIVLSVQFGTIGIWISFSTAEVLTTISILYLRHRLRKKNSNLDELLLDTSKEKNVDITFSVQNNSEDIMFASNKITEFCDKNKVSPKDAMKVSLAIEEMLAVIITKCMNSEKISYIDIRVRKLEDGMMLRIRNTGKIFNPIQYYEDHKREAAHADELLGLKIIIGSCRHIDFHKTFGVNNLLIMF